MSSAKSLVEACDLTKAYRRVAALDGCTLSIQAGEVFGLLGPNGSGKTTLLRLMMGFLRPTRGRATIAGHDCYTESVAVHAGVSYLPGDVRFVRGSRARDVLTFFARVRGQQEPTEALRIADLLGLDLGRRANQMSTGMRQKLALSVAFAVDAPLLILDEPTSNLDPTVRNTVLALVRKARADGRTVIFSSHVLSEIEQTCDRVVILREGKVVHDERMSGVRRGHRILAEITAALPALPPQLIGRVIIAHDAANHIRIDAPGDLAPLLSWLATLPLAAVHIEPIGLEAVYERYHREPKVAAEVAA
jgi:ABC-2 type transport system ATP-binding protein